MFRGPSWEILYRVPLRSPSPSSPKRLEVRSRVARQKDFSSGASSRLAPKRTRKFLQCLPAEIGPSVACRVLLAVSGLPVRLGLPSRSPDHHAHPFRVAEAKFLVICLWITGISVATVGTLSKSPVWLLESAAVPNSAKCLNR